MKEKVPVKRVRVRQILEEAWIGDAVLSLYARSKILNEGALDSEKFVRMTSNRFLSAIGEASEVEAGIGRIYLADGLEAAFRWMDAQLWPRFEKQEQNRLKRAGA
jgi:dsRNA-specific ribonuclease